MTIRSKHNFLIKHYKFEIPIFKLKKLISDVNLRKVSTCRCIDRKQNMHAIRGSRNLHTMHKGPTDIELFAYERKEQKLFEQEISTVNQGA